MSSEDRPTPPTSTGQLARTPFAHLVVYAHDRQLTGTFDFVSPSGANATLLVQGGRPSKARLSAPPIYLGQVLLEIGLISAAQLDASLREMSSTRKLHGEILLGSGAIDIVGVAQGLRAQLMRKLGELFLWDAETTFAFYSHYDGLVNWGGDPLPIDPMPTVWSGIREHASEAHAAAALARVREGHIRLARTAQLERFGLLPDERRLLDLLRVRPMSLDDLIMQAEGVGERTTRLLIYCLAIAKQIEIVATDGVEIEPEPSSSRLMVPPELRGAVRPEPSQPAMSAAPSSPRNAVGRVALKSKALSRSYSAVEELVANRSKDHRASPPHGVPQVSSPQTAPAQPAPPPAPAAKPAPPPPKPAPAAPPPDYEARRIEITERARVIDRENYFEMLGVTQNATADQVKNAYFALAKTWHPDRLPSALADVKDSCARVFARMSEAHQTLADAERRADYLTLMKEGGETPEQQEEINAVLTATVEFQKADICLKKNDTAQAEALARRAHQLDPQQADYLALLAWLESMRPEAQAPEATDKKIDMLNRAIALNPRCARAHFYRGMLHKRIGKDARAFEDFKSVIKLDPKNIDAQREVRLFEMRGGSLKPAKGEKRSAEKPSLFKKLFGK